MEGLENKMRMRGKIFCIMQRKFPVVFWKTLFPEALDTFVCWCREDAGGTLDMWYWTGCPWREKVSLEKNMGSVGIWCSAWQSVLGDSYIVMEHWVEDYFHAFKSLDSDLARWTFPRKQLDVVFPAFILFPRKEVVCSSEDKPPAWHKKAARASSYKFNHLRGILKCRIIYGH